MHPIIKKFKEVALKYKLHIQNEAEKSIGIFSNWHLGIQLHIKVDENDSMQFYFLERTFTGLYEGERTDLHDVISLVFGAYLKRVNICSPGFLDIDHL